MYAWGDGQANKAGTCMLYNATGNLHQKLNTIHKDYSSVYVTSPVFSIC